MKIVTCTINKVKAHQMYYKTSLCEADQNSSTE